jgi:hypothetical protein
MFSKSLLAGDTMQQLISASWRRSTTIFPVIQALQVNNSILAQAFVGPLLVDDCINF